MSDICENNHGGNSESQEANLLTDKERWRANVMGLAKARGEHGLTADEAAEHFGVHHNTVAPRISELKKDGLLAPNGTRRLTRSGCKAAVVVVK